jgi:hypothetical protein
MNRNHASAKLAKSWQKRNGHEKNIAQFMYQNSTTNSPNNSPAISLSETEPSRCPRQKLGDLGDNRIAPMAPNSECDRPMD